MRILFVIPAYAPFIGGAQTFAHAMLLRLVQHGHGATVLTTNARQADDFWAPPQSDQGLLPTHEEIEGVEVVRLPIRYPWPAPYRFGALRRLGHWLQRSGLPQSLQKWLLSKMSRSMPPVVALQSTLDRLVFNSDLVQVIDATWDGLFTIAGRTTLAAAKPLVLTPLLHTGSTAIAAHFTMPHQLELYEDAAAVIALTQREKAWLVEHGVASEHISVLPMGVDEDGAGEPTTARAVAVDFRQQHALQEPLIAFVGAATFDKGAHVLIHAVLELLRNGRPVWLACVGPQQEQLQRLIEHLPPLDRQRLHQHVRLLGVVDEATKQALLAASTVLVLPSRVDSFGIVLLEAWRHAKPVVAASEGGPMEIVRERENGLLVPFGDADALAKALAQLFEDPAWARQLGAAGRQTVMAHYTWDQTYDALFSLYRDLYSSSHGDSPRNFSGDGGRGDTPAQIRSAADGLSLPPTGAESHKRHG